jgi:hypothetical protein
MYSDGKRLLNDLEKLMKRSFMFLARFPPSSLQRLNSICKTWVDCVWNVMAHAQKPDFVFQRKGRVHLNRPGGGVSSVDYWKPRCAALAVVMLDTPCSEVVWRVLATHSIRQFPLHFPSRASPCAITFQLDSNKGRRTNRPTIHVNIL